MSYSQGSSFLGIKEIDLSDDTSVDASGGTNTQSLTPPIGQIYKVVDLLITINTPGGTSTGSHKLQCNHLDATYFIFSLTAAHDAAMQAYGGQFIAGSNETPSSINQQFVLMHEGVIVASNASPVDFVYTNSTDVAQTTTRTLKLIVEVYKDLL